MAESPIGPTKSEGSVDTSQKPTLEGGLPTSPSINQDQNPTTANPPSGIVLPPAATQPAADPPEPAVNPVAPADPPISSDPAPEQPAGGKPSESEANTPSPITSTTPAPEPPSSPPPSVPSTPTPPLKGEEMGPPWLRTDPKVRAAQDNADAEPPTLSPTMSASGAAPPWQVPSEKQGNIQSKVFTANEEKRGGFPVVIFVILILAIIAGIIAYFIIGGLS